MTPNPGEHRSPRATSLVPSCPTTDARLRTVASNPATNLLVARSESSVIGMALLLVCIALAGQFGLIEEVAVDEVARGQRVATRLLTGVPQLAVARDLDFIELTSRPSREAANGLYRSLGFTRRETNVYRHGLHNVTKGDRATSSPGVDTDRS